MNNKIKKMPVGLKTRQIAASRLTKVLNGAPFIAFNAAEIEDARDRAFANKLITIALKRHGHINYIFEQTLKKGMPARSGDFESILRIGISELLFMPSQAAHSSIFLSVEATKNDKRTRHLSKLTNGVLRNVQRGADKYKSLPNRLLFPNWLYEKWQQSYGEPAIEKFAIALLDNAPLDLVLSQNDETLIKQLGGQIIFDDVVRIFERDRAVNQLTGYDEGRWWVQDVSATLPAKLMSLKENSSVLDMCVAPGGKLAQLIKQKYQVTGLDIDKERLKRVQENLKRLNYSAKIELADARTYKPNSLFDGVLLDAPCSATGTFRRHPELLWQRKQSDIKHRVKLQRELITNAINCLKPNGILVYATCSLEIEEGEQQANWITQNFSNIKQQRFKKSELGIFSKAINKDGFLRVLPSIELTNNIKGAMDGFFIARFIKT